MVSKKFPEHGKSIGKLSISKFYTATPHNDLLLTVFSVDIANQRHGITGD